MHFDVIGTGPAVLLLHGTPSPARHLVALGNALSRHHQVFVAHLPGYGETPPAPEPYSIEGVNRDIAAALRAQGVQRTAVIGFSAGAYRAFALALAGNIQVTGVLALAGFLSFTADERAGYRGLASGFRAQGATPFEPVVVERMLSADFARTHSDAVNDVRQWVHAASAEVLAAELDALAGVSDLGPRLRELTIPIVARTGTADGAIAPNKSDAIVAAARQGRLELVEGAGHALLLEDFAGTVESATRLMSTVCG